MGLLFVGEKLVPIYLRSYSEPFRPGPDVPEQITSLALDGDAVWAASGPHAIKYLRGKPVSPSPGLILYYKVHNI